MKKIFYIILALSVFFSMPTQTLATTVGNEKIISQAAVVMDVKTGQVIYEKNMNQTMFPASITKILTCALALEKGFSSEDSVTMTDDAVWSVGRETTHIALTTDENVPVKDLVYSTMIQSANDSSNGIALYVSNSLEEFAKLMTDKAHSIGAKNSNFTNANGLPQNEHFTTAYDMALITRWALTVDGFRELFGATEYEMAPTNKQPSKRYFYTKHKMLDKNSQFYYDNSKGGKLGWTEEAAHTGVTLAKKDDMELICVVMNSENPDDKYLDTKLLLDEAFRNYNLVSFTSDRFQQPPIPIYDNEAQVGEILLTPSEITILKPSTSAKADIKIDLNVPVRYEDNGEIAPTVSFILDNKIIAEIPFEFQRTDFDVPIAMQVSAPVDEKKYIFSPIIFFSFAFVFLVVAVLFFIRSMNIMKTNKRLNKKQRLDKLRSVENAIIRDNKENNTILFPTNYTHDIKSRPPTAKRVSEKKKML